MKKLTSTQNIMPGSIIRLYKKGYGYDKIEVIESNDYYLAGLCTAEFADFLKKDDIVEAYLWINGVASFDFTLEVIGSIQSDHNFVFFKHAEDIIFSEERKCLMAEVDLPVSFFELEKGDMQHSISKENIVQHAGRVILLSDREAVITIDSPFQMEDHILVKARLNLMNRDWELIGKLFPTQKNDYMLLFSGMSDKERNKLLEYVFSIYRE